MELMGFDRMKNPHFISGKMNVNFCFRIFCMATVILFRTGFVPKLRGCGVNHSPVLTIGRGFRSTPRIRDVKKDDAKKTETILGVPYNTLAIGVPKETFVGERRVAVTPAVTAALVKKGFSINVESGAGALASFRDGGNLVTLFPIITQFII